MSRRGRVHRLRLVRAVRELSAIDFKRIILRSSPFILPPTVQFCSHSRP